jgi:hypothetical protein
LFTIDIGVIDVSPPLAYIQLTSLTRQTYKESGIYMRCSSYDY